MSTQDRARSVRSMTGYGHADQEHQGWRLGIEIRSVNSRFLDLTIKAPEDVRSLESALRELVQSRLARGKVELRVNLKREQTTGSDQLDSAAMQRFAAVWNQARAAVPNLRDPGLGDVLGWPGVRATENFDAEALRPALLEAAQRAVAALIAAREREGAALAATMGDRVGQMRTIAATLKTELPAVLEQTQAKITERMEAALGLVAGRNGAAITADEARERIRQEVVMIGMRIDVAEELDRLQSHCNEVDRLLASGKEAGKRLDFLIQEMHREANTLGSKMVSERFSQASIDLKVLIEQLREQVQNIE
jgi:uncharacterized protein (TIGR00255 family)